MAVYAVEHDAEKPPPVTLADPCQPREVPSTGGLAGAIQEQALKQLDSAACKLGVPREELALAIFDADRATRVPGGARRRPAQHDLAAVTARRGLAPAPLAVAGERTAGVRGERGEVDRRLAIVGEHDQRVPRGERQQRLAGTQQRKRATEPPGVEHMVHRFNGGVAEVELFVFLLFAVVVLAGLGLRSGVPYPVAVVLGGLVIGLIPGLPRRVSTPT